MALRHPCRHRRCNHRDIALRQLCRHRSSCRHRGVGTIAQGNCRHRGCRHRRAIFAIEACRHRGNEVHVVGTIDMPVLFGSLPCQVWKVVKFHVISASSSFNAILGRTTITALRAITSISHLKMKFPTDFGVGKMIGDQTDEEFEVNLDIDPRSLVDLPTKNSCSTVEETEEIKVFEGNLKKTTRIGKNLPESLKKDITCLIREFADIFSWDPKDMPGIPEIIAHHSLHINKNITPIRQKCRIFSDGKKAAIDQEIDRLLEAKFIEPVQFSTWISNVVLVKKSNGKWRMCVDYSDVNRACPGDFYPLPNID
ncbi:uncharacterized protein LOC141714610 [Apium graveolens]|uniref:uncharacterized protein LOC141714610 n=1 Tax=Apium graveolens TaxID=4045 RepID=UPI003D795BA8